MRDFGTKWRTDIPSTYRMGSPFCRSSRKRYVEMFEALERMAPADDRPALEVLTRHEVVAIDFAERELAGDADSVAPLRAYLDDAEQQGRPE